MIFQELYSQTVAAVAKFFRKAVFIYSDVPVLYTKPRHWRETEGHWKCRSEPAKDKDGKEIVNLGEARRLF